MISNGFICGDDGVWYNINFFNKIYVDYNKNREFCVMGSTKPTRLPIKILVLDVDSYENACALLNNIMSG